MSLGVIEENINDFWRMIWQEKISTVVMTTKLKEVKKVGSYFFLQRRKISYFHLCLSVGKHKEIYPLSREFKFTLNDAVIQQLNDQVCRLCSGESKDPINTTNTT